MLTNGRSPLLRYAVSVITVVAALGLNLLSWPSAQGTHSSLFFAAVMVSAWYGGLGACPGNCPARGWNSVLFRFFVAHQL